MQPGTVRAWKFVRIFQPDRWKIGREALFRCVLPHYSMHRGARNESSPDSRRGSSSILTLIFPAC